MLDDLASNMEKNCSRTNSAPPNKLSGAESKNNAKQDGSANKIRVGRWRESQCPRAEPSRRKPTPQRNKGLDKRPKPRGLCADGRDRNNIANGPGAEVGSALQQGSKKLNLNHLLNFTYSPRGASQASNWGSAPWRNRSKWNTKKHKYNKEQFLQANCQFVVRVGGDYAIHAVDPDLLVDWDAIELVRLPSQEVSSCPICLFQPVAAKMTRCGHIYCWPCILHYLALSDKTWRKCPICFEAIHKKDLKSVVSLTTHQYLIGEEITLRLMRREKGSVFAMAKMQWKDRKGQLLCLDDADENTCFAKILTASPEQVLKVVVKRERKELEEALIESQTDPESCFIESAMGMLAEREACLMEKRIQPSERQNPKMLEDISPNVVSLGNGTKKVIYTCAFANVEKQSSEETSSEEKQASDESNSDETHLYEKNRSLSLRTHNESTGSTDDGGANSDDLFIIDQHVVDKTTKDVYYFYQASNGQHVYMHAINAHMLIHEYGSLENSPETLTAKIVEREGITMSEQLRKRLRYLSHLPLSCEFDVVELDMQPPLVSGKTLVAFKDEVEKRRRRRNKRARDELRRERQIQAEENRKMGLFPKAKLNLQSHRQFPQYVPQINDCPGFASIETLTDSPTTSVASSNPVLSDCSAESLSNSLDDGSGSARSFAQMLRDGKARPDIGLTKPSTPDVLTREKKSPDSESDLENYVPVPDYHTSFGDAIQAALLKATLVEKGDETTEQNPGKKKKKGGKQKQLLFTTSMSRNK